MITTRISSPTLVLIACVLLMVWARGFAGESLAAEPDASTLDASDDWNQWRGPYRDGRLMENSAGDTKPWPNTLQDSLKLAWKKDHGPSYSGPVTQGGLVFTTETINKQSERVTARYLQDGSEVWQREWEGAMAVPFFAASNGDWIRSTPACTKDALVVLGMRDVLVCLEPATGNEKWRVDFPNNFGTPLQSFGAVCWPVIANESVYVQLGGGLTKLSLSTGEVQWTVLKGGADMMSSGAFSSPSIATIAGQPMLLVQTRQELCGVSLDSGEVFWREPIQAFRGMNILTPTAIGDAVFTPAHSGTSQLFDIAFTTDGWKVTERWSQKTQGYMSSPVIMDGHVYLHLKNERFTCLSALDGTIRWTSPPVGKYWSMVRQGSRVLALANDGKLRLIEATPEEYRVMDELKVADDSWAHLGVQGENVIVRALDSLSVYRWNPGT